MEETSINAPRLPDGPARGGEARVTLRGCHGPCNGAPLTVHVPLAEDCSQEEAYLALRKAIVEAVNARPPHIEADLSRYTPVHVQVTGEESRMVTGMVTAMPHEPRCPDCGASLLRDGPDAWQWNCPACRASAETLPLPDMAPPAPPAQPRLLCVMDEEPEAVPEGVWEAVQNGLDGPRAPDLPAPSDLPDDAA